MSCPNKNSKEFKQMVEALGEDLTYYLWDKNNGNTIHLAPNGKESKLYKTLLDEFDGDEIKALQAKAKVYSNNFTNWFGDWADNPENSSKVVDENGEPLMVYHGTDKEFNTFDISKAGKKTGQAKELPGVYFSNSKHIAKSYTASRDNAKGKIARFLHISEAGLDIAEDMFPEVFDAFRKQDKYKYIQDFVNEYYKDNSPTKEILIPAYLNIKNPFKINGESSRIAYILKDIKKELTGNDDGVIVSNVADGLSDDIGLIGNTYIAFNPNQIKSATDNKGTFSKTDDNIYYSPIKISSTKNNTITATVKGLKKDNTFIPSNTGKDFITGKFKVMNKQEFDKDVIKDKFILDKNKIIQSYLNKKKIDGILVKTEKSEYLYIKNNKNMNDKESELC